MSMVCPVSKVNQGLLTPPEPGQEADGEHTCVGEHTGAVLGGTSCGGQDIKSPATWGAGPEVRGREPQPGSMLPRGHRVPQALSCFIKQCLCPLSVGNSTCSSFWVFMAYVGL